MFISIQRTYRGPLDQYKEVLDSYSAIYNHDGSYYEAIIYIGSMTTLFVLSKQLGHPLITEHDKKGNPKLEIYDDWRINNEKKESLGSLFFI